MPIDLTDIQFALKTISSYSEIELNEDTPIKEFGIDSLDMFEFISILEDKTGKQVTDEVFSNLHTTRDVILFFNE
jgi:acyl carrier protein